MPLNSLFAIYGILCLNESLHYSLLISEFLVKSHMSIPCLSNSHTWYFIIYLQPVVLKVGREWYFVTFLFILWDDPWWETNSQSTAGAVAATVPELCNQNQVSGSHVSLWRISTCANVSLFDLWIKILQKKTFQVGNWVMIISQG